MDNPEPHFSPPSETVELQDRYDSLEYLVVSMLVLVTFLATVLTVFLWRQQSEKGWELANFSAQANNYIAQYEHGPGPAQQVFVNKLTEFGRSHSDFLPILARYGLKPSATSAGAVPATSPPPATKK